MQTNGLIWVIVLAVLCACGDAAAPDGAIEPNMDPWPLGGPRGVVVNSNSSPSPTDITATSQEGVELVPAADTVLVVSGI